MKERKSLKDDYLAFGNQLEKLNIKTFKNHCYWRIANDNACNAKWDTLIKKPFYKNADLELLIRSVEILKSMLENKSVIDQLNKISLGFRRKI